MKKRFKEIITTMLGILIGLMTGLFLYLDKVNVMESILLFFIAWVFIAAKDSILEGITFGLLKLPKK